MRFTLWRRMYTIARTPRLVILVPFPTLSTTIGFCAWLFSKYKNVMHRSSLHDARTPERPDDTREYPSRPASHRMKRAREDASSSSPSVQRENDATKRTKTYTPTYIQLLITSFDISAKGLTDRIKVTLREAKDKVITTTSGGGEA